MEWLEWVSEEMSHVCVIRRNEREIFRMRCFHASILCGGEAMVIPILDRHVMSGSGRRRGGCDGTGSNFAAHVT